MRMLDYVLAWLMLATGVLHCGVTFVAYSTVGFPAIWFFGAGVGLILGGMLNLLRVRHASTLPVLRTAALIGNLLLLAVASAATVLVLGALAHNPQILLVMVSIVGETIFSLLRRRRA